MDDVRASLNAAAVARAEQAVILRSLFSVGDKVRVKPEFRNQTGLDPDIFYYVTRLQGAFSDDIGVSRTRNDIRFIGVPVEQIELLKKGLCNTRPHGRCVRSSYCVEHAFDQNVDPCARGAREVS